MFVFLVSVKRRAECSEYFVSDADDVFKPVKPRGNKSVNHLFQGFR